MPKSLKKANKKSRFWAYRKCKWKIYPVKRDICGYMEKLSLIYAQKHGKDDDYWRKIGQKARKLSVYAQWIGSVGKGKVSFVKTILRLTTEFVFTNLGISQEGVQNEKI